MVKKLTALLIILLLLLIGGMAIFSPANKDIHNQKSAEEMTTLTEYMTNTPVITSTVTPMPHNAPTYTPFDKPNITSTVMPEKTSLKKSTAAPVNTPEGKNGLVELLKYDSSFIIDLKYATDDNFTGKKI
jgi:hypothetical protein